MWLIFAILDALMSGISVTLSKAGLKNINPTLAFAIQSILILVISWSAVFVQKEQSGLVKMDKNTWIFIACAGVATCLASLFQFRALKDGNVGAVTSIDRSSLVFAVVLATIFLKEKISWQLIVGAVLIIGGAVLIATNKQAGK